MWIEGIYLYYFWSFWMIYKDRVFWCWLIYCFMDGFWKIGYCFSNDLNGNDRFFFLLKLNNLFICLLVNGFCLFMRRSVISFVFKLFFWYLKDSKIRIVFWVFWVWFLWWGRWLSIWLNSLFIFGRWVRDWVGD